MRHSFSMNYLLRTSAALNNSQRLIGSLVLYLFSIIFFIENQVRHFLTQFITSNELLFIRGIDH